MKKKENKKKWNDAYRKRVKEKACSQTMKRSLILEKQRHREYYTQYRNVISERRKKKRKSRLT